MLTQNEINTLNLSATKKDFVQIWNELLEVAGKLSERWDPTSTNESDPGIVILKALTGIADKLNYNIDKNTLEAFMPTAAQEDSMRKLCEMLGYNIKYYQSAITNVTVKYYNPDPDEKSDEYKALQNGLEIPKFTAITNSDQDINYFIIDTPEYRAPNIITNEDTSKIFTCMEGQLVKCESINENNVITVNQISEDCRFYLPEYQIAENGIFIYNVAELGGVLVDGTEWKKVDNLNVQVSGARVYKFGYDSYESRPYVEFPVDYSKLFGEGIFLYYARTRGAAGNVSPRALTKIELPTVGDWGSVSAENFSVENVFAATTGSDIETIKQAYNNFKKTIGTFETLVTCRDYMNKIYLMTGSLNKPIVSNILVTDIRSDLNRAITICSCDDAGIFYKETSRTTRAEASANTQVNTNSTFIASEANKPRLSETAGELEIRASFDIDGTTHVQRDYRYSNWYIGNDTNRLYLYVDKYSNDLVSDDDYNDFRSSTENTYRDANGNEIQPTLSDLGTVSAYDANGDKSAFWLIKQGDKTFTTKLPITWVENVNTDTTVSRVVEETSEIDHFDLVFYPFKAYTQIRSGVKDIGKVYDASFNYSPETFTEVRARLEDEDLKTIAHNIIPPRIDDIISINNYHRLSATIATNSKITTEEGAIIIDRIKIALANAFNMRELDFGEEIPFDSIVDVMEHADSRVRVVSLNEPALYTTFSVYKGEQDGVPLIVEYAVASDWLTSLEADTTDRFTYRDAENNLINTFDTAEARKIYNKLAVRNVLAGRVPLFNYNTTFTPSFSEAPYQITEIDPKLSADDDYTTWVEGNTLYTGTIQADGSKRVYSKTYTPTVVEEGESEGKALDLVSYVKGNEITDIYTTCEISADADNTITDVKLEAGEFIKFRAPNFITEKTYPAYVNYHLALNTELKSAAINAEAISLFDALDEDRLSWSLTNKNIGWQKVLNYFSEVDKNTTGSNYKKVYQRAQKISKFKFDGASSESSIQQGPIVIKIDDVVSESSSLTELLQKSGCIRLSENHEIMYNETDRQYEIKAILKWDTSDGDSAPNSIGPNIDIRLALNSPFITDASVLSNIESAVQAKLTELANETNADGTPILPTNCAWQIIFEYEGVPFDATSLEEWQKFIKGSNKDLLKFTPATDGKVLFWRAFDSGYAAGKYILSNTSKLLKFEASFFDILDIHSVLIAKSLGKDSEPSVILNDQEYKLDDKEYLYIEYTPSSTAEDGTTQELSAVTEVYGPGTIIRPSGFDGNGLIDSTVYTAMGNSPHKTVTFETEYSTNTPVEMHSFGVSEQIEIRDFARVVLSKEKFNKDKTTPVIWYYKNFNGCDELEKLEGANGVRTYTLRDGEYIFYTDNNKAEFAYFTTGTEVTLEGNIVLAQCDIIDLSTIFDSGISEIPWKRLPFSTNADSITFQEYQYITLGPEDTLKQLTLLEGDKLDSTWQACDVVEYLLAGAKEPSKLPPIQVIDGVVGNGWKACSVLELNVSADNAQALRNDDKVKTSITLVSTSPIGDKAELTLPSNLNIDSGNDSTNITRPVLYFKTNLSCQASSGHINIKDVYANPSKLKGFEFKFFSADTPAIVKTKPGTVTIYNNTADQSEVKNHSDIWRSVSLDKLQPAEESDRALQLPISILPNTYGVFCIYIQYAESSNTPSTWVELLPGVAHNDITLLNVPSNEIVWKANKLYLKPGINCLKVNKTNKIFIKTSEKSAGELYFDELRLVNCATVAYTDPSGALKTSTTQGLNLEQLGYLAPEQGYTESDIFDSELLSALKTDYTNEALDALDAENDKAKQAFAELHGELLSNKSKVDLLISFVNKCRKEITGLLARYSEADDDEKLVALFQKYNTLYAELVRERNLRDALDRNSNIDELEAQLAELLNSFIPTEGAQQQLADELNALLEKAHDNYNSAKNFSNEAILDDFELFAIKEDQAELSNELKNASLEALNEQFNSQLATISSKIFDITNSESRTNLLALLDTLNSSVKAEQQANLLSRVRQLVEESDQDQINSYLDEMYRHAVENENAELASTTSAFIAYLNPDKFKTLITEIELSAAAESYTWLDTLLVELKDILTGTTSEPAADSILGMLNTLLTSAQSSTTGLASQVTAIRNKVSTEYRNTLKTIVEQIQDVLEDLIDLDKAYATALAKLQETNDAQIKELLSNIDSITAKRNTTAETIANFEFMEDFTNYSELPFGKVSVIKVWPTYIAQSFDTSLTELYETVKNAITSDSVEFKLPQRLSSNNQLRVLLTDIIDIAAFEDIFESAANLALTANQNSARRALIEEIGQQLSVTSDVTIAMNEIVKADSDSTQVLRNLFDELASATTVIEKQRIAKALRAELTSAIDISEKLVDVSANLLCHGVLLFDEILPVDETTGELDVLYLPLAKYLTELRSELLASDSAVSIRELLIAAAHPNADAIAKLKYDEVTIIEPVDDGAAEIDTAEHVVVTFVDDGPADLMLLTDPIGKLDVCIIANKELLKVFNEFTAKQLQTWLESLDEEKYRTDALLPENYLTTLFSLKSSVVLQNEIVLAKTAKLFEILNKFYAKQVVKEDDTKIWLGTGGVELAVTLNIADNKYYYNGTELELYKIGDTWYYKGAVVQLTSNSNWLSTDDTELVLSDEIQTILRSLVSKLEALNGNNVLPRDFKEAQLILELEKRLLRDIQTLDIDRSFYYTAPLESNLAIEFNQNNAALNTLANPIAYYDINNINNNFVISKLDIDYLDRGLQIARSSRLN